MTVASETLGVGELLTAVEVFVRRFIVMPNDHAVTACALFTAHTHAIAGAHATPYLAILSAERQSGKTRLLEVVGLLAKDSWHTASTTDAALFRKVARDQPTLLLDEIDALFGSNSERTEPIRAVLNAGNRRGAVATRVVGQGAKMDVVDFSVFCAKMLAGIDVGRLPETIQDRSIVLRMKRRRDGEQVERFRYRFAQIEAEPLRAALAAWAESAVERLGQADPPIPIELSDRAGEAWEPLLAIADMAGAPWPDRARKAAIALSAGEDGEEIGRGAQLLAAVEGALVGDQITTSDLLEAINTNDEIPFGGWRDGKGLDARTLARLLKPYDVRPRTIRTGADTAKGYRRVDLLDAFARYLPQPPQASQADTELRPHPFYRADVTAVTDVTANTGSGDRLPNALTADIYDGAL